MSSSLVTVDNGRVMVQIPRGTGGESRQETIEKCWMILNHDLSEAERMITLGHVRRNMLILGCRYPREAEQAALKAGNTIYH